MPKVEPFEYQKSTNIDEHNQIVNKVNELVDVVNDVNLDQITPEIDALKTATTKNTTDISQLKISDAEHTEQIATIDSNVDNHAREITALKAKDATHDTEIAELDKVTDALTKEIPNGITLYRDGTGKIKAVISQEDDTTIDSNVLDMIIPYQYDIISGTTSRSFKLDITMSDGTKYTTNDFVIPAGGGTSVSITAITLTKNADNPNKFKVSVKLDDGSTIDSGEIEMVTSVSGTFANNKLTITVNGISSTPITIDTTGTAYTAGTGIKIASGVISIDDTKVALKSDISDMETKTNANATFATKTALTTLQNSVGDAFSQVAVGSDGKSLDFTALDGQVNNVVLPSSGGGDEWITTTLAKIDTTKIKLGTMIMGSLTSYTSIGSFQYGIDDLVAICAYPNTKTFIVLNGLYYPDGTGDYIGKNRIMTLRFDTTSITLTYVDSTKSTASSIPSVTMGPYTDDTNLTDVKISVCY